MATAAKINQLGANDEFLKTAVDEVAPVGAINGYMGTSDPTGWLIANGRNVSRTTYADLFALFGTAFGAGDGSTTFALPNMAGRTLVGVDSTADHPSVGAIGGAKAVTLSAAQMPSHAHSGGTTTQGTHQHNYQRWSALLQNAVAPTDQTRYVVQGEYTEITPGNQGHHGHDIQINAAGGGQAHTNLAPYFTQNWIIKT